MRKTLRRIRPVRNWRKVMRRAWSVRLMVAAAFLSGGEIVMPLLIDQVPIRYRVAYGGLTFLVISAAVGARFVAQSKFS